MNIEDWPKPRWGHPLPGWTKYEKIRAVLWISLLAIIILLGLAFTYLGAEYRLLGTPRFITPKNVQLPLSGEYYFQAINLAEEKFENVRVSSITLLRDPNTLDKIIYTPIIEFCSLDNPDWSYQIEVTKIQGIIKENQYSGSYMKIENQVCSDMQMNNLPAISSLTAIEAAQDYIIDNKGVSYDLWPFSLEAKRDEDRLLLWILEFHKFEEHTSKLTVKLNASNGEVLDVFEHTGD